MAPVIDALTRARRVVVAMHVLPDGDTTGSALGLASVLAQQGKQVRVVCPDPVLGPYRFLPGADRVGSADSLRGGERADVVVTVDCGDVARCFGAEELAAVAPVIVNIDHHVSNPRFGDVNWVDPERPAVGDMVVDLCDAAAWPLTLESALCFYVSIVSDTEGLRFGYHDGRLLATVSRLVAMGIDPDAVSQQLWEQKSWHVVELEGWFLSHIERAPSKRVAWVQLPYAVQQQLGVGPEDSEGLVTKLRAIAGVGLAVVLREDAAGRVKVSLRTRPPFDAAALAVRLGGGGHRHSAGIERAGPLNQVLRALLTLVADQYGETISWTDL